MLTDREKFILFAVAFQSLRGAVDDDKFFKDMYGVAKFYLPTMKQADLEKFYVDEIMPEFDRLLEKATAFRINRQKEDWGNP